MLCWYNCLEYLRALKVNVMQLCNHHGNPRVFSPLRSMCRLDNLCNFRQFGPWSGEGSGSVVECLTRDRGVGGWSLTGTTAFCQKAGHIIPYLVVAQRRKTSPDITERLLMGRKESNQTNKNKQASKTQIRTDWMSFLIWFQTVWH